MNHFQYIGTDLDLKTIVAETALNFDTQIPHEGKYFYIACVFLNNYLATEYLQSTLKHSVATANASTVEAAKAVNALLCLSSNDQGAVLEVLEDFYFIRFRL